jgi:hypothetical protein
MTERESFVYFIRPIGMEGPIKIGVSWKPESRLSDLMAWSPFPLELIVTIPGDKTLEYNVQRCFADTSSHGEWFGASPRLLAAIEALKAGVPVHQAIDLENPVGQLNHQPKGGAAWPAVTRERMGRFTTMRFARQRFEQTGRRPWNQSPRLKAILRKIDFREELDAAELLEFNAFVEASRKLKPANANFAQIPVIGEINR